MVKSMNVTIRDVNESVFRKFKAKAVGEGMKLGQALTQAMEMWIRHGTDKRELSLLDIETFDWGKGTEKASVEIDKNIYG
jgi:predicted nucleic acid binding AN1-type Zn finger protein